MIVHEHMDQPGQHIRDVPTRLQCQDGEPDYIPHGPIQAQPRGQDEQKEDEANLHTAFDRQARAEDKPLMKSFFGTARRTPYPTQSCLRGRAAKAIKSAASM